MVLFNENGEKVKFDVSNKIGGEVCGNVYRTSFDECLKVYVNSGLVDVEILKFIKELSLDGFYEIYDFFYNKSGKFKAYTMKFYKKEEIDILTMPIYYTLNNFFNLLESVDKLTLNNVFISDMHSGNVIIGSRNLVVIDTDLYSFNKFFTRDELALKNRKALLYLFKELYIESIKKYHMEYRTFDCDEIIRNLFKYSGDNTGDILCKKLIKYEYPIDFIRAKLK